ncbi:MAG: Formamidopyrimidine-DNA glycosylase [Rhodocyclaceae bacterium]|nr:Formamidopyrimidine-DNA glycosylase [Rhodocyclaceae bacterium]
MPELPEVEVTRRGLEGSLRGDIVTDVIIRDGRLRWPVDAELRHSLRQARLARIDRRGKYLLMRWDMGIGKGKRAGTLIVHLGMSGSLRIVRPDQAPDRHDHVELVFGDRCLRLRDPRRFGAMLWATGPAEQHPLLAHLGIEPLSDGFDGAWLYRALRGRSAPVKSLLMNNRLIVGVGNIYAAESLFRSGVRPGTPGKRLGPARADRLARAVRETLEDAIALGGSSLRDYLHSDGGAGCFQLTTMVYGRAGEPCRLCGTPIRVQRQAQRSTYYCPNCQK